MDLYKFGFPTPSTPHLFWNGHLRDRWVAVPVLIVLTKGYDYNALILATPEGRGAYDPRYKTDDLFEDGTRAYFTIKYLF